MILRAAADVQLDSAFPLFHVNTFGGKNIFD